MLKTHQARPTRILPAQSLSSRRWPAPTMHKASVFGMRNGLLVVAAALLAALVGATPVLAGQPKGDFAVFAQCNLATSELCIYAKSTKGELRLGKRTVPIIHTIVLQGGSYQSGPQEVFTPASNGETLSNTAQAVPGGLPAVIEPGLLSAKQKKLYEEDVENNITAVTATIELLSDPGISLENWIEEDGVALSLPVRVKLSNPFLGSACYIGTGASPVELQLTTGTTAPSLPNTPISGAAGDVELKDSGELVLLNNYRLVDNAFSAPEAKGCGGAESIVPAVDAAIGLPAGGGHNTAVLEGDLEVASEAAVLASE